MAEPIIPTENNPWGLRQGQINWLKENKYDPTNLAQQDNIARVFNEKDMSPEDVSNLFNQYNIGTKETNTWTPESTYDSVDAYNNIPTAGWESPSLTGAQAYGYTATNMTPTSYTADQVNLDNVRKYTAAHAGSQGYQANQHQVGSNELVADQLTGLLDKNSAYMQQARTDGMQQAHQRGLLNTSMAGEAAQAAAIRAGLPIAQADANTYWQTALANANADNRAMEFGAGASNTASLSNANADNTASSQYTNAYNNQQTVNQSAVNNQLRFGANAANLAASQNATAANRAAEHYASAQNTASIQNANNEMQLAIQQMAQDTSLDKMGLSIMEIGFKNGVFTDPTTAANYLNMAGSLIPNLGIQVVTDLADQAASGVV